MPGASATATAAACAKRFDEPMTKFSNVYLGFSRSPLPIAVGAEPAPSVGASSGSSGDAVAVASARSVSSEESTETARWMGRPKWPASVDSIQSRWRTATRSREKSLGTATTRVDSCSASGCAALTQGLTGSGASEQT